VCLRLRLSTKIVIGGAATVFFFVGVLLWAQTRLRTLVLPFGITVTYFSRLRLRRTVRVL
jgi:hypothetical protein